MTEILSVMDLFALTAVMVIGLPHGAFDGAIAFFLGYGRSRARMTGFLVMYLFLAGLYALFWSMLPVFGLARFDWVVPDEADAIIIELGANDALRGINPDVTRANLEQIIEKSRARGLHILLAGMLAPPNLGPAYGKRFAAIYPDLARKYNVALYPFFLDGVAAQKSLNLADGIHPNAAGIDVIVSRIGPYAERLVSNVISGEKSK